MIPVRILADCENQLIPKNHQYLLRINLQHLLEAYGSKDGKFQYNPENDGYIVYIEATDENKQLTELGMEQTLTDFHYEDVTYSEHFQCFDALLTTNNSFAYQFIIPNKNISAATRKYLQQQLTQEKGQ